MKPIPSPVIHRPPTFRFDERTWYAFELGREWKLSLAEIEALFGSESIISVTPKLLIIQTEQEVAQISARIGGIIRAFKVDALLRDSRSFPNEVSQRLHAMPSENRITFGLGVLGASAPLFTQGLRLKKELKDQGYSMRLANKDDQNLVSAVVKKEDLVATSTEFFLLEIEKKHFLAHTIHIQDIDAYSGRDLGKSRDMEVGMLPPKLAQTMINLALGTTPISSQVHLYDPFCGLGTVLIEGVNMGIHQVYASDISPEMTTATKASMDAYIGRMSGMSHIPSVSSLYTETLDAQLIGEFKKIAQITHIVTEGYLGRIFGQHSIKEELVVEEKKHLLDIYGPMFASLANKQWKGTVVMTIPCWETKNASIYFGEFYQLLGRYGFRADPLLADRAEVKLTKFGSLIYRRPGQTVGREVVRMIRK